MRRIALLGVATAIAAVVAGVAQADPGLQSTLTAVTGQGTGHVLVAPTAEDQGTFAVQVTVNIQGATPYTTFAVPARSTSTLMGSARWRRAGCRWVT